MHFGNLNRYTIATTDQNMLSELSDFTDIIDIADEARRLQSRTQQLMLMCRRFPVSGIAVPISW